MATKRQPIAYHDRHYYSVGQFYEAVASWVIKLQAQPARRYGLYADAAYPFTVMLFALWHAGKEVWVAGNNRPGTASQLLQWGCQLIGDWGHGTAFDFGLTTTPIHELRLSPLDPLAACLVLFTSGSTGLPKPVVKHLWQFQLEIDTLEQLWGKRLGCAEALATVSHQHIYGLLFRILWPLSAGRCFHSDCYLNPETLMRTAQNKAAYWVASPAHLKRLDQGSPWRGMAGLCAVFSSGGALQHKVAQQILACSGQSVTEIYGSTETGGIAWRQQGNNAPTPWTLFAGMALTLTDTGWQLCSPYLQAALQLDDHLSLQADGRFILHGRLDRIVKIEEKRLSLAELEQRLLAVSWVAEAYALVLTKHRDVVGAALVLTAEGLQSLKATGRKPLIKQLRAALHPYFDAVVLPRKWLFLERMPLNTEGKAEHAVLTRLLDMDSRKSPYLLGVDKAGDSVDLTFYAQEELPYFPGHFPDYPILPGVVQIAWAEQFGRLFFALEQPFLTLEVIKFVQVIQPGTTLKLTLNWKAATGKLYFNFSSGQGAHSSGRLVV